jgi:iron complex transport system permease protein
MDVLEGIEYYWKKKKRKNIKRISFLCGIICILFLVSVQAGYTKFSLEETFQLLMGAASEGQRLVIFEFRLPRIVLSLLIGAGFSLSGCVMQAISKNPLADPGLLGINQGASLLVVLFVIVKGASSIGNIFFLPFLALIGGGLAATAICILSYKKNEGVKPIRLILNGVAMSAAISAAMTLIVIKVDSDQFDFISTWQAGSIWSANWKFVLALLPWIILGSLYLIKKSQVLDVLTLGEQIGIGLGVNIGVETIKLLAVATALAASCVAVSGNISFVGMICPHLARRMVGPRHRILVPTCMFVGAILVCTADTIGRVTIQPSQVPTGIVIAIIGAPYFIYLLLKSGTY